MHTISFLAHAPEFHVPNKNDDSKAEVKPGENNSVDQKPENQIQQISSPKLETQLEGNSIDQKPENQIQQISSPKVETQVETVVEQKVINSVDLPQTNIFMPQPGEIIFFLLLIMPFLLFSMKRYIFR
ncbi:hypothetical protein [Dapis sp. BLCC M172]|uniref:hypothetical protein n=1 Tax=Dapis sp. BLCC M172 TaxID=2975281 RepID=UPI003CF6647A